MIKIVVVVVVVELLCCMEDLLKEDKLEASEGCKEEPSEGETHITHS